MCRKGGWKRVEKIMENSLLIRLKLVPLQPESGKSNV